MNEHTTPHHEPEQTSFIVEPALPEDAEGIFNVQRSTWLNTYPNEAAGITEEDIRVRLEGPNGELIPQRIERWRQGVETTDDKRAVFVVKNEGEVIGFVAPAIMEGQRRIGALYVLPGLQGKGIGYQLTDKAVVWHGRNEDIFLHVARYNNSAIGFYERYGFVPTGRHIEDEDAKRSGNKEIPEIEMVLPAHS